MGAPRVFDKGGPDDPRGGLGFEDFLLKLDFSRFISSLGFGCFGPLLSLRAIRHFSSRLSISVFGTAITARNRLSSVENGVPSGRVGGGRAGFMK